MFRTYFAQHTLVMEEAINGRVDYGFILVTCVFYPCTETTKLKKKKKKESFQIFQAKSKFAGAGLATRQSFHSGHLQ